MIPLEGFFTDPRNQNVIAKAKSEKLWVRKLAFRVYKVMNRRKWANKKHTRTHGEYVISFGTDRDGQRYAHCTCPAGNPPIDANGIPAYEPRACYHVAYCLPHHLRVARKAKEREQLKQEQQIKKPVLRFFNLATAQA